MSDIETEVDALHEYAEYLKSVNETFGAIREYVHSSACDKSGFTGLLMLLQPAVDLVEQLFDKTLDFGVHRMDSMISGVEDTAKHYEETETHVMTLMTQAHSELDSVRVSEAV
jgi:hypothetical protein